MKLYTLYSTYRIWWYRYKTLNITFTVITWLHKCPLLSYNNRISFFFFSKKQSYRIRCINCDTDSPANWLLTSHYAELSTLQNSPACWEQSPFWSSSSCCRSYPGTAAHRYNFGSLLFWQQDNFLSLNVLFKLLHRVPISATEACE